MRARCTAHHTIMMFGGVQSFKLVVMLKKATLSVFFSQTEQLAMKRYWGVEI
jgi:hypothetical protein